MEQEIEIEEEPYPEISSNKEKEQEITVEEFKKSIKKMKLGKAAGHDAISP
mgnify:CR=1 FL=1